MTGSHSCSFCADTLMLIAKWRHLGTLSSPVYFCPLGCASLVHGDLISLTLMNRGPLQSPLLLCYTCSPRASFDAVCLRPQEGFLHSAAWQLAGTFVLYRSCSLPACSLRG